MNIRYVLNDNPTGYRNQNYSDFLNHSLLMLRKYTPLENVEVTYVPPVNHQHVRYLRSLGVKVRVRQPHPLSKFTKYAFKLYLYHDIPDDLIIVDADTWIWGNPELLLSKTSGLGARVDPCSYRHPRRQKIVDWGKYRKVLRDLAVDWRPPIICNGHMVFRDRHRTERFYDDMVYYFHMIERGSIDKWMPDRYKLFMANMLSVFTTYPREDITFFSAEEIGIERYEYAYGRSIMMDRRRLGK